MHPPCCRPSTSWVHYTTSCKHSLVLLKMGVIIVRIILSWLELLINLCRIQLLVYIICINNSRSDKYHIWSGIRRKKKEKRKKLIFSFDIMKISTGKFLLSLIQRWMMLHYFCNWTPGEVFVHQRQLIYTPGILLANKDGEDQLDRSCEKLRIITESQGAEEYPTWNKKTEG
jgi:hypothetical protein